MAAPASAAPIAASAISSGVTGRCGDMEGVWIAPVTAQVMMTLRDMAIRSLLCVVPQALGCGALVRQQRREPPVAPGALARDLVRSGRAPQAARTRATFVRLEHRRGRRIGARSASVEPV